MKNKYPDVIHVLALRADGSDYGHDYHKGDMYCKHCGAPNLYETYGGDYYYPMRYYCPECEVEWSE